MSSIDFSAFPGEEMGIPAVVRLSCQLPEMHRLMTNSCVPAGVFPEMIGQVVDVVWGVVGDTFLFNR